MSEQRFTRITLHSSISYRNEQEAAEYSHVEVQILRWLSEAGVLPGVQMIDDEVRYSDDDLAILRRVRRLYEDLGVNLEGVEIILRLHARLDALQRELDRHKPQ